MECVCMNKMRSFHVSGYELQKQLQFAHEMALVPLKRINEKQSRLYNLATYGESTKVGDLVWNANKLWKKGVTSK